MDEIPRRMCSVTVYEISRLERYGGKINILAVEFRQWCASLWRGTPLAYTIALLTVLLASLLWRLGQGGMLQRGRP